MLGFPFFEFILLVLGFGFLIFVHELGHFAVAKWVGIRCPQFAIGFGKAAVSWRKGIGFRRGTTEKEYEKRCIEKLEADGVKPAAKGPHTGTARYDTDPVKEEHASAYTGKQMFAVGDALGLGATEYRLNWLPLGGYVKMLGQEDMDPNARSDDPNAYNNKPIWARACVISAGVVMNMIFGAIFLAIAFSIGVDFPRATVGSVYSGMPASTTYAQGHEDDLNFLGLQQGDVITRVNGKTPEDFKDVAIAIALSSSASSVEIVVERYNPEDPDKPIELTFSLTPERQRSGERLLSAGFEAGPGLEIGVIENAEGDVATWYRQRIEAVPTEQRQPGQSIVITAVNGQEIDSYPQYQLAFAASGGEPVSVTFTDRAEDGASATFEVASRPTLTRYPDGPDNLAGLVPLGVVSLIAEDSPAEAAGMKAGDILIQLGDAQYPLDTRAIVNELGDDRESPRRVIVLRDGERIDLGEIVPDRKGLLGLAVMPALDNPMIGTVLEGTPAAVMNSGDGFVARTEITHINDQAVTDWADIQRLLTQAVATHQADGVTGPLTVTLTIDRHVSDELPLPVTLTLDEEAQSALAAARWVPDHSIYTPLTEFVTIKADGIGDALMIGMDKSRDFVLQTYITLMRLIQGDVKLYNLRGPVGIISTGTQVAQQGNSYLLYFLGLISINLAVINFLPIPIVDGGHMVFLAWEKLTGKPPSEKVQVWSLYAGLAVIGFVFIATFYFDVMREISRFF